MIRFYNGSYDSRPTVDIKISGGRAYAIQMNPDGSTESVNYDDFEYGREYRLADPDIDATPEQQAIRRLYRMNQAIGREGYVAEVGHVCEIVKGRKYPVGTTFVVTSADWKYVGPYRNIELFYLSGNGIKVEGANCKIIGVDL